MCTLSFVPRRRGYVVAMNRDERLTRVEALPPKKFHLPGFIAIYPHEPGGGTWIAANDHRATFALLNLGDSSGPKQRSRGEIIPALIGSASCVEADAKIRQIDLGDILPFRVIGIFGGERQGCEWRWDGRRVTRLSFPWRGQHWFSSGLSDARARRGRLPVCQAAWRQRSAGSLAWLWRLHRSHRPAAGPFSICVHRPDARTRSYTEIVCGPSSVHMRYLPGSPCATRAKPKKLGLQHAGR